MRTQLTLFAHDPAPSPPTAYAIPIYRVELVRDGGCPTDQPQFRSATDVATLLQTLFATADREYFLVLLLDRKNRLIGMNTVAMGSLTAAVVHPREVFKPAILANAAAIICAHNHPSGDPEPSQEDKLLTRKLVLAGEALGIQILDHLVLGMGRYVSFRDTGLL